MNEVQKDFLHKLKKSGNHLCHTAAHRLGFSWRELDQANKRIEDLCKDRRQASKRIEELEKIADNAHNALCAVKDSGAVREDDVIEMIDRGLDNKEQK